MNSIRLWVKSAVGVIVFFALLLAAGGFATLTVQSQAPGNVTLNPFDQLLKKLDQIITTLTPPPVSRSVTLTTPIVRVAANEVGWCFLANVGTETIGPVNHRILNVSGGEVDSGSASSVPPGAGHSIASVGGPTTCRCEFTFEGTASAVRANMLVTSSVASGVITSVSVDAR